MKLSITIEYNSGESSTYTVQPPDWAKWEKETGNIIGNAKEVIGIWDLMFLAYTTYKRQNAGKPVKSFDVWCETVANVETEVADPKATSPEA